MESACSIATLRMASLKMVTATVAKRWSQQPADEQQSIRKSSAVLNVSLPQFRRQQPGTDQPPLTTASDRLTLRITGPSPEVLEGSRSRV